MPSDRILRTSLFDKRDKSSLPSKEEWLSITIQVMKRSGTVTDPRGVQGYECTGQDGRGKTSIDSLAVYTTILQTEMIILLPLDQ